MLKITWDFLKKKKFYHPFVCMNVLVFCVFNLNDVWLSYLCQFCKRMWVDMVRMQHWNSVVVVVAFCTYKNVLRNKTRYGKIWTFIIIIILYKNNNNPRFMVVYLYVVLSFVFIPFSRLNVFIILSILSGCTKYSISFVSLVNAMNFFFWKKKEKRTRLFSKMIL